MPGSRAARKVGCRNPGRGYFPALLLVVVAGLLSACGNTQPVAANTGSGGSGGGGDTTPPSQPGNLSATLTGSTSASLSWNASTDNVGVTGYVVRRNGTQVATPTATSFIDPSLSPATIYNYTVAARDAAGNTSVAASAGVTTAGTLPPAANTYYVATTGNNLNSCAAAQDAATPKLTIQAGLSCLAPAGTLIIRDGTYSGTANALSNLPNGSAGNYITIKAENEGNVIITAGLNMSNDAYLIIQGLRFQDELEHRVSGNHLKLFRNEFKGGCRPSGNCTNTVVGGTDILFEDNWWHGLGGRYNLLIYNSDRVLVRRGVIRHDGGWTDTNDPSDPEAGLNFYNSSNCSAQNVIILDSNLAYKTWQSAFYSVSNSSSSPHPNSNNSWLGIIALNNFSAGITDGANLRFDGIADQTGHVVEDAVLWDAYWGMNVAFQSSVDLAASRLTIGRTSGSGTGIGGNSVGTKSFANVRLFNMSIRDVTLTSPTTTGAPTYLPQQLGGIGANIVTRIGTAGTLQGEAGWNTDTGVGLWPFPNEARIMKEMCTDAGVTRGFCSDTSLTNYIMNYLGNGNPFP